ncbi:hypothetical protein WJX77_002534 [Trebouxia sp. C0004]
MQGPTFILSLGADPSGELGSSDAQIGNQRRLLIQTKLQTQLHRLRFSHSLSSKNKPASQRKEMDVLLDAEKVKQILHQHTYGQQGCEEDIYASQGKHALLADGAPEASALAALGGDGDKPKQTSASASNKEGDVQQVTKKRGRPSTQDVFVDSTNKGADPSARCGAQRISTGVQKDKSKLSLHVILFVFAAASPQTWRALSSSAVQTLLHCCLRI